MQDTGQTKITRINVVGTSGSGKSTFCKKLSEALSIPHIEMDAIFWGPNWYWPSDEEFFADLKKALSRDAWILDGNYTRTTPIKWEHVQMVIWLDYSFPRTLFHAVKRAFLRSLTQEELWPNTENKESFWQSFFTRKSIIWWTVTTYKKRKEKYERLMVDDAYAYIQFVQLRSPTEAETFLKEIASTPIL